MMWSWWSYLAGVATPIIALICFFIYTLIWDANNGVNPFLIKRPKKDPTIGCKVLNDKVITIQEHD